MGTHFQVTRESIPRNVGLDPGSESGVTICRVPPRVFQIRTLASFGLDARASGWYSIVVPKWWNLVDTPS